MTLANDIHIRTFCQSGSSSPLRTIFSDSFRFRISSACINCFWAEMSNGFEGILVNWQGFAAGLEAVMEAVLVGINSWSCNFLIKKYEKPRPFKHNKDVPRIRIDWVPEKHSNSNYMKSSCLLVWDKQRYYSYQ